jgi:hypothetical protein
MERESIGVLKKAKSLDELKEAVNSLGIFISLKDQSWIAIRYNDLHVFTIPSSAVALDSSGKWYASTYHFCGQFGIYRSIEEQERMGMSHELFEGMMTGNIAKIHALASSGNLLDARKRLLQLDFYEITP